MERHGNGQVRSRWRTTQAAVVGAQGQMVISATAAATLCWRSSVRRKSTALTGRCPGDGAREGAWLELPADGLLTSYGAGLVRRIHYATLLPPPSVR